MKLKAVKKKPTSLNTTKTLMSLTQVALNFRNLLRTRLRMKRMKK